jgi:hypothetical protein
MEEKRFITLVPGLMRKLSLDMIGNWFLPLMAAWDQCYETFYARNLQIFLIS